jgi:TolB-like protein/DNA-binding winged helix-turn-helix (wHTH) protein/thioredoxin-like negative regulator of GroEL
MDTTAEIRFDNWTLHGQPRELLQDGVRVRLQEQPLQILEELLAHPGQVVTREQLIALLWPKRIVDYDSALNAAVRRLRAALGDEAETPRYIETIPRHGYRFIGTVLPPETAPAVASEAAPSPPRRSPAVRLWPVWVALAVATFGAVIWSVRHDDSTAVRATPQRAAQAIAVLPFVDLSAEQDQQYFSDGLTEELISRLAAELPLRVIARTSSFSFKGQTTDIATVARKLGVTHVLEGSVRKSGDQVRITAQLIDATSSSHLWTQSYDRKLVDFLQVQDEIAQSVASALQVALSAPRSSAMPRDARVYEQLFHGRFFFQRRGPGDLERAREYYERAIAIDAGFAPAWAGLAGVHWISIATGAISPEAGRDKVREAAQRALQLDPGLAEAHLRMANYFASLGNGPAADEQMRQAAAAEPNNPLVLGFAASAAAEGDRFDEAIELQRRAVAADPWSAFTRSALASFLYLAGRFEEARAEWLQVLEISPGPPPEDFGLALIQAERFDEALKTIGTLPDGAARKQQLALVYHALGRKSEADAALKDLIATSREAFAIAEVCAYRGEIDAAFEWLRLDRLKDATQGPFPLPHWIKRKSPFLESLHADARWDAWDAPRH